MRLGAYEIQGELGRGASGTVFRARGPDGRPVAIKLLHRLDERGRARFERERRLLAAVAGEGFVPLLDAGEAPQGPWVALPLLEGGSLRARLSRGPLAIEDAVALGISLARAMGNAHARGVIHRDLKPENVLFDAAGRAFIADLGLAKHFDADAPGAAGTVVLSKTSELRGTPAYMAPEQIRDSKHAGPPADVFALGAILYECLAGVTPFGGVNLMDLIDNVESGKFKAPRLLRREVPRAVDAVVRRALARDPAARYPDGAALARAIEEATRPRPERGRFVAAGLGVALVLSSVLFFRGGAAPVAPPRPSHPPPSPQALARDLAREFEDLINREDVAGALATVARALERDPDLALAYALRARVRVTLEDHAAARADVDRAVALAPSDAACRSWRAHVLTLLGKKDEALAEHERAFALDPRSALLHANRAATYANAQDFVTALVDADRAVALDPRLVRALNVRTYVHVAQGRFADALADATLATELEPRWTTGWIDRAGTHLRLGDPQAALDELEHVVKLGTRDPSVWIHRSDARVALKDSEGGIAEAAHAIQLAPARAHTWHARARALLAAGRLEEACADFDRAIDLDPKYLLARENRGRARLMRGDNAGALSDFEAAPATAEVHVLRGIAASNLGNQERAIDEYTRAIERDSLLVEAYARRATAYHAVGDKPAAIRDLETCLRLAPEQPQAQNWREGLEELSR